MTVRFITANEEMPWTLWNAAPGDDFYSANFYTQTEPYERRRVTITSMRLADDAERRERERGLVPQPELPQHVIEWWAERDAEWLAASILSHLAGTSL